jgi:hypothetical protein
MPLHTFARRENTRDHNGKLVMRDPGVKRNARRIATLCILLLRWLQSK